MEGAGNLSAIAIGSTTVPLAPAAPYRKNSVRAVQTNYKRVSAYGVARELAEKRLEAEEEKLKVGLSTNFIVLTYQRELSNARSSELKAIIDYTLSIANLEKAKATSPANMNMKISDYSKR